jgi:hypothetical protein
MISKKGKEYNLPFSQINIPRVRKGMKETVADLAPDLAKQFHGEVVISDDTIESWERARERLQREAAQRLVNEKSAVKRQKIIAQHALDMKRLNDQISKRRITIYNYIERRKLEDYVRKRLEERQANTGEPFGEYEVREGARRLSAEVTKGHLDDFLKHTKVAITSGKSGEITFNAKSGKEYTLEWFQDSNGKNPSTYIRVKDEEALFIVEPVYRGFRNHVTGNVDMVKLYEINVSNKRAAENLGFDKDPFPQDVKFYSEDEAKKYFINWLQTSGHHADYANVKGTPGRERFLITSRQKNFTWAIYPYQDKTARRMKDTHVGKWIIEAIGPKNTHDFSLQQFNSREEAERWLREYIAKYQL